MRRVWVWLFQLNYVFNYMDTSGYEFRAPAFICRWYVKRHQFLDYDVTAQDLEV